MADKPTGSKHADGQPIGKVGLGALVIVGSFVFEFLSRRIYTGIACGMEAAIRNDVVRNVLSRDGFSYEKDQQVREVLELAGLETFVEGLPDGMDTMLEENGKNLSGGQRQRLAITHDTDCDFMKRFDKRYKVVDGDLVDGKPVKAG